MAEVLLTGATGTVGYAILRELLGDGRSVRALVRSAARAKALLPGEVELAEGDVTDAASVRRAMQGCSVVYHASGLPEQWLADPDVFRQVNVEGTRNVVEVALEAGVQSFMYTSTIDVFEMRPGAEFDESVIDAKPKGTHYERSKQEADRLVTEAFERRGLPVRFLHPSGVYGPAATVTAGLNSFVRDLERGKVPMLLPGGFPIVYAEDVARGHVLAEKQAAAGARFILSEAYWTLKDFAAAVYAQGSGRKVPPVMPSFVAQAVSSVGENVAKLTKKPPLIPAGQLHFLESDVRPSSERARRDLGWSARSLQEGLGPTLAWLRERGEV